MQEKSLRKSKYNFMPNKKYFCGTRFANANGMPNEPAILAAGGRKLPYWQYPLFGTGYASGLGGVIQPPLMGYGKNPPKPEASFHEGRAYPPTPHGFHSSMLR